MKKLPKRQVPGPKSSKYLDLARACEPPCAADQVPVVWDFADRVWVTDVDGNRFLDFSAGISPKAGRRRRSRPASMRIPSGHSASGAAQLPHDKGSALSGPGTTAAILGVFDYVWAKLSSLVY